MANFYEKQLQGLLSNPNSFQGTPGFQFARDQGLEAATRKLNAGGLGGSGNALAELTRLGTGYAMQDYGNQVDRLGRLTGQQQQYQLGETRNTNDYNLGLYKTSNDFQLGSERNALDAQANWWNANNQNNQFNLGQQRGATDWYNADTSRFNADTNRGNAMADIFFNAKKYGY